MKRGDVIFQTTFKHCQPTIQASFAAPKGRVAVMLLLGDADKKDPYEFDPNKALNDLGWIEEPVFDEDKERELFEEWADEKGFCLDCKFFEKGNNFEDQATQWLFEA